MTTIRRMYGCRSGCVYLKYDSDGRCRSSMTSNESSTRGSFSRTGSTNARRFVSTALGTAISSGGLHGSASGDSEQESVVDSPTPLPIIAVSDVDSIVDVIPDCTAMTELRGVVDVRLRSFHQRAFS